ncbi:MAG TPA: hypothetical protein VFN48_11785 [Solirubrobacteraceae bacterium]|nr:hypothetical protein [Solirubrobacteraceae bacterium]
MNDSTTHLSEHQRASEMVERFLSLAGISDQELVSEASRLLQRQIAEIRREGLREPDLAVMGQAYIRAVGRIVAAETEVILRLGSTRAVTETRPERQLALRLLPLGRDVFDVLHGLLLRRAMARAQEGVDRSPRSTRPTAVAHVDVIASTALLRQASILDTQRLVDGLFGAAQAAVRDRPVEVIKYVGDGVFLAGPDPREVAQASLACIHELARSTGLRSRAGLAFGRVVHRAGDVFGLPVNLSHALTKRAPEGAVLATAVAPAQLPASMCRQPVELEVPGLDAPLLAYRTSSPVVTAGS